MTHDRATGRLGIDAPYLLVDESVPVVGTEVARDETKGMRVVRVDPPARLAYATTGLYDDGWGADRFTYRRYDCDGGTLAARLAQDPNLVPVPQRVTATSGSLRVATEVEFDPDTDRDGPARAARRRGRRLRRLVRRRSERRPGAGRHAAARRAGERLPVHAVRIVFDVSPLALPRTGVGNYVLGSLRGLAGAVGPDGEVVAFALTGPRGRRAIPHALDGVPVRRRLLFVPGARWVRERWSTFGRPPVQRLAGRLDVFHYSDWMFPAQRGGLRSTMVHDLIPLRFPEWTTALDAPDARGEVPRHGAHGRRRLHQLALHGRRRARPARRGGRAAAWSRRRESTRSTAPRGRRPTSGGRTR